MNLDDALTVQNIEKVAKQNMSHNQLQIIAGGALYDETVKENMLALKRYKIRPRVLRNVSNRDLSTTILGHRVAAPIGISPSSSQRSLHPDGEAATAIASAANSFPLTLAMATTVALKDIMKACPSLFCFQQILISNPKVMTEKIVRKAEENQAKGLVVTVDYSVYPIKLTENRLRMDFLTRFNQYGRFVVFYVLYSFEVYKIQKQAHNVYFKCEKGISIILSVII